MRLLLALTLIALLAPAAATAGKPTPAGTATPSSVDFGTVTQGTITDVSREVTITNTGKVPIIIGGWNSQAAFNLDPQLGSCPLNRWRLPVGRSCTFVLVAHSYWEPYTDGVLSYYPVGTYTGVFAVTDVDSVEVARVPLTMTVTA